MGASYRVDHGECDRTVADVRVAAAEVAEHAAGMCGALDALVTAAGGSPEVAAALASFAVERAATAERVGTHLQAVSAVGVVALAAVDEADARMASRTSQAARR